MSNLTLKDFEVSEYNVTRGNISENRKSKERFRLETVVDPGDNTTSIVSGSSESQDSNYSLESWTRGRYQGTDQTYLIGNNPSLSLTPLKIAVFERETKDKTIGDLLRSTPRSPEFEEGYFVTYVRQSKLKPVPPPSITTLTPLASGDTISIIVSNNNVSTGGKPVTTQFRVANGEWFTFDNGQGIEETGLKADLVVNVGNLPPDTEITFQVRNKMRVEGFETFSRTITKSARTLRKPVTATFVYFQDVTSDISGSSPFKIAFYEPPRYGFDFKGWEPSLPRTITEDTTFIAQWEKLPEDFSDPVTPVLEQDVFLTGKDSGCGSPTGQTAKSTQSINSIFPGTTKIRQTGGDLFQAGRYGISGTLNDPATAEIELDPTGRVISLKSC